MTAPAWAPTPADVAPLVSDRDLTAGAFTATTVPTVDQVTDLIASIARTVESIVGPVPATLHDLASRCVTYGAARDVDLGYTSGRARDERPRALDYDELYQRALDDLRTAIASGGDHSAGRPRVRWHGPPASTLPGSRW